MKNCNVCKQDKPIKDFYLFKGKPLYRCKKCACEAQLKIIRTPRGAVNQKVCKLVRRAKRLDIILTLTRKELFTLYSKKECHYCKKEMLIVTLDRLMPPLGYVNGNVVACCMKCNQMKSSFLPKDIPLLKGILSELEKLV